MNHQIARVFDEVISVYPKNYRELMLSNRSRMIWQIETAVEHMPKGGHALDIGAGIAPFMLVLARMGYRTSIMEDFADATLVDDETAVVLKLFEEANINVIRGDAFDNIASLPEEGIDLVTTHDSMEHWHNSPKALFHVLWERMNEGGMFWIGVPNCVNLRKRITVPFGFGKWSGMKDWYEQSIFRGHVREPDVDDLRYIARDVGANKYRIVGKNWLGYRNSRASVRAITPFVDRLLQLRPSLCSDIYLLAWK